MLLKQGVFWSKRMQKTSKKQGFYAFFDEKRWFLACFWGVVRVYCCWVNKLDTTCSCDFSVFLKQLIRYN
jgi:hypothetical protein